MAISTEARRAELATFLRTRRERISPADVGLPPRTRTRTPGLRREDVANLAGVGVTWYTWLEQGRDIRASPQVLDAVARALRLDEGEHEHLYRLAHVPSAEAARAPVTVLDPEIQQILDQLETMACVIDERYDVLAMNRAFSVVLPTMAAWRPRPFANLLWCIFCVPDCCDPYVNRDQELPYLVATFRAAYGHHVGEPAWEEFISELSAESPVFARMWQQHEVGGYMTRERIYRHPATGLMRFGITNLGVLASPGVRMLVYLPRDAQTAEAVRALVAGSVRFPKVMPCGHVIKAHADQTLLDD